jgi:hypothetical protein
VQSRSRLSFQLHKPKTYLIFVWSSKIRLKPNLMVWMIAQIWANVYHFLMNDRPFDQFSHPKKKMMEKIITIWKPKNNEKLLKEKYFHLNHCFPGLGLWFRFRLGSHTYIKWFVAPGSDSLISLLLYLYAWFPSPSGLGYARSKRRAGVCQSPKENLNQVFQKQKNKFVIHSEIVCRLSFGSRSRGELSVYFTNKTKQQKTVCIA